jgi:hypothetical protein
MTWVMRPTEMAAGVCAKAADMMLPSLLLLRRRGGRRNGGRP